MITRSVKAVIWLCSIAVLFGVAPSADATDLHRYVQKQWRVADGLPSDNILTALQTKDGYMWIGTDAGLVRFDGVKFTVFDKRNTEALTSNTITRLVEDKGGVLWVGTTDGVVRVEHGTIRKFRGSCELCENQVLALLENRDEELLLREENGDEWRGTGSGLVVTHEEGATRRVPFVKPPVRVNTLLRDRWGNLWAGTNAGLFLHREGQFQPHSEHLNFLRNYVTVLIEDWEHNVWVGTHGKGLIFLRDEKFDVFDRRDGLPEEPVIAVFGNDEEDVLAVTASGVFRLTSGAFEEYPFPDGDTIPTGQTIQEYVEDAAGRVWLGERNRVVCRDGEATSEYTVPEGRNRGVVAMLPDKLGNMWIGTDGAGLHRLDEGELSSFGPESGLLSDHILSIHEDNGGRLWVGTLGGGLHLFLGGRFHPITKADGLPGDTVRSITDDGIGRLWLNLGSGIARADKSNLVDFVEGRTESVQGILYGEQDGLTSLVSSASGSKAAWRDPDGKIWFAMDDGVAMVNPKELYATKVPPAIHIEKVVADGEEMPITSPLVLGTDLEELEVHFTAISYSAPEAVAVRYFLHGDWRELESSPPYVIRLRDIPAGFCHLTISATNSKSAQYEKRTTLEILKEERFYEAWGFHLLAMAIVLLGIVGGYQYRIRSLTDKQLRLDDVNKQLESVDLMKNQILTNTSHELRTPINGIVGLAESLLDGAAGQLSSDATYNLGIIKSSGNRLLAIVNDILDYSKLRSRDLELSLASLRLRGVAEATFEIVSPLLKGRPIEAVNRVNEDLGVMADENRLMQILVNLVGNAVKFTDEGAITVGARRVGSVVEVKVEDTGIGIPTESQETIFDSFEQAGTVAQDYGGTGIGLAISRKLVELHGGRIWVESTPGKGAAFYFTLKASDGAEPKKRPSSKPPLSAVDTPALLPSKETSKGEGPLILTVDDNAVNQKVLLDQLGLGGYRVHQVMNGKDALAYLENNDKPALVILDVIMPGMSGDEVCKKVRERFTAAELPIVMLTAKTEVEDLVTGFNAGANDYLPKPCAKDELLRRIHYHVELSTRVACEKVKLEEDLAEGKEAIAELEDELRQKYAGSGLTEEDMERIAADAKETMEAEKLYRKEALTIGELAESMGVLPNHLSYALNGSLSQNFHAFVNTYRLEEVKQRLADPAEKKESILIIAYDAGFKSKSAFNAFFRKATGTTPTRYRKKMLQPPD